MPHVVPATTERPGPPAAVLAAFGLRGAPFAMTGGEGVSFQVGDAVVKWVHDPLEAAWTQDALSRIEDRAVRTAEPIRASEGGWVYEGWIASEFIAGLRPTMPDWATIADVGMRFSDALDQVARSEGDVLAGRTHRWARADRVAWSEADVALPAAAAQRLVRLRRLVLPGTGHRQIIHGDLSGNVFLDRTGVHVVLDVSPYHRPRRWAAAIVVADAGLWHGADRAVVTDFASGPPDLDLLSRALIFRLVAEHLTSDPRHGARLGPYDRVLAMLD